MLTRSAIRACSDILYFNHIRQALGVSRRLLQHFCPVTTKVPFNGRQTVNLGRILHQCNCRALAPKATRAANPMQVRFKIWLLVLVDGRTVIDHQTDIVDVDAARLEDAGKACERKIEKVSMRISEWNFR